jgi:predicted dehydrogenase
MDRTYVFGSKGSLLATGKELFLREGGKQNASLNGDAVELAPLPHETSNPAAYLLYCIREKRSAEGVLAGSLNVQVMEILDAARESVRTGRAVELR